MWVTPIRRGRIHDSPYSAGQAEAGVGGGELGPLHGEAEVAEGHEGDADPGAGPVDGGDHRLAQPELPHHVAVELGPHAVAGIGRLPGQGGVVVVGLHVVVEGLEVGSHAEGVAGTGHHDHPDLRVGFEGGADPADLGVHPPRPRVAPPWSVEPEGGHPVLVDLVPGDLELHGPQVRTPPAHRRPQTTARSRRARPAQAPAWKTGTSVRSSSMPGPSLGRFSKYIMALGRSPSQTSAGSS